MRSPFLPGFSHVINPRIAFCLDILVFLFSGTEQKAMTIFKKKKKLHVL